MSPPGGKKAKPSKGSRRGPASGRDLASLLAMAADDLELAERIDWTTAAGTRGRYVHAYGAALSLTAVVVRGSGYRPGGVGHHAKLFELLEKILPAEVLTAHAFDKARRKRNTLTYEKPEPVSPDEARELLERVRLFREGVLAWLKANRPDALPPPPPAAGAATPTSPSRTTTPP